MARVLVIALALAVIGAERTAHAWQPDPDQEAFAVDRRGADQLTNPASVRSPRLDAHPEWSGFLRDNAGWVARWDERTGRLVKATGPAANTTSARIEASNVEMDARRFLRHSMSPWIPAERDLEFVRTAGATNQYWVHFTQRMNGIPVWNSRLSMHVSGDGRATRITNRSYPDIRMNTTPNITPDVASRAAAQDLPVEAEQTEAPTLIILPIEQRAGTEFRLTWKVGWRTMVPAGHWISFVDAENGTLLWRFNAGHHADVAGQVTADVEPTTQGDAVVSAPLAHLALSAVGGGLSNPVIVPTDANGQYALATPTLTGRQLRVPLAGSYGTVIDAEAGFNVPEFLFTVPDATPLDFPLHLTDTRYSQAGLDAYHFSALSHDYVKAIDPSLTVIDFAAPIIVNYPIPGANLCNAFWNGEQLVFFSAGDQCANSARVATVVMHEYGHLVTDLQYRPFYPSGAMHEGFSDYLACTMTNQPVVGPGWRPGSAPDYIRRIDTDRIFPNDASGQSHNDGLIIASTLWDLREILGATLVDSLWHYARYGYSDNFDDYFIDFLHTDDDNGNIYDGTPHFSTIVDRFRAHGIGDYDIHVSHAPELDTEDLSKSFPLRATFLSIFPLAPESVRIHLELEDGGGMTPLEFAMTPTGGIREFQHLLEPQPAGTEVRYWFTAADTAGGTVIWPSGGSSAPFVFQVGTDSEPPTILHEPLDDQPVDDDSRLVLATITDNLDRGLGTVRLVQRRNGADSTSNEMVGAAPDFRGALPTADLNIGDAFDYRIEAADSAMTPNIGRTPLTGWHQFHIVGGVGRDFEADAGGAVGGGDWQWGVPGFGLTPPSGQRVWGTDLTGAYKDNLASTLEFAPINLSGFTGGTLLFHHYLDCEPFYDGGIIETSSDAGMTWQLQTPDGGYPVGRVEASDLPGFSGSSDGWQPVEVDLSASAGNPSLRVRLRFFSDVGITGPGWYIDDVKIVDRRARLRPAMPLARSDEEGNVTFTWSTPPGYLETPAGPVIGYHVYRATIPGGERVRLTDTPLLERSFLDSGLPDGLSWDYEVTALYESGESRPAGPATASRVRPVFAGDWSVMEAEVDSGAVLDTLLVVRNAGTGVLRVNSYAARIGQTVDDVRILLPLSASDTPWDTLFADPSESDTLEADLRWIEVRQTADSLLFRLTAWRPWGDPFTDFSLAVELDFDDDITSGPRGEFFGLIGARSLALLGEPQGLFAHSGGSSYIHAGSLLTWSVATGGRSAIIGFDKTGGSAPPVVRVVARVYDGPSSTTEDRAPDIVTLPWMAIGSRHLEVNAGEAANLGFRLGAPSQLPGIVSGAIVLDVSELENQGIALPIALQVASSVSVILGRFLATPIPAGLELTWTTVEEQDHLGFRLARRTISPVPLEEIMIGPELIRAGGDSRTWQFIDTDVRPGFAYEYRLADVSRSGHVTWHGPFAALMPGASIPIAMQLSPAAPNPAPGATSIAWAIPGGAPVSLTLFSVDGRTVRRLLRHAVHEAGWHETAWDGRDEDGNPAPSGVYFYRLEAAGRVASRKLLLVR